MKKQVITEMAMSLMLFTMAQAQEIDWSLMKKHNSEDIHHAISNKQSENNANINVELGMLYHALALQNEKGASAKAVMHFTQYIDSQILISSGKSSQKHTQPNPMLLALLGSSKSMLARDSKDIGDKIKYVNQGVADLNEAVMLSPENINLRQVRITVFAELPSMFKKNKVVLKDIAYLIDNKLVGEKTKAQLMKLKGSLK